jgi:hypothetical protein
MRKHLTTIAVALAILSAAVFAAFGAPEDLPVFSDGLVKARIEMGSGAMITGPIVVRRDDGQIVYELAAGGRITLGER